MRVMASVATLSLAQGGVVMRAAQVTAETRKWDRSPRRSSRRKEIHVVSGSGRDEL